MKKMFINENNLSFDQIDEEVIRVKVLIINSNNEILLGHAKGTYQFIGGHMELGETFDDAINREVKEESGIELVVRNAIPFLLRETYIKNYMDSGKNRCNKIYYFTVMTDKEVDVNNTNYTDDEQSGNFCVRKVKLSDVRKTILDNNVNSKYKDIAYEMLDALDIYFEKNNN